jgi:hypothetical protein
MLNYCHSQITLEAHITMDQSLHSYRSLVLSQRKGFALVVSLVSRPNRKKQYRASSGDAGLDPSGGRGQHKLERGIR